MIPVHDLPNFGVVCLSALSAVTTIKATYPNCSSLEASNQTIRDPEFVFTVQIGRHKYPIKFGTLNKAEEARNDLIRAWIKFEEEVDELLELDDEDEDYKEF